MPSSELAKLKASIQEFGFIEPIVINMSRTIIGGHQRFKAALELRYTILPCIVLNLPEIKEKALNLALNRIHGEFDTGMLAVVLQELEDNTTIDELITGFDQDEIDEIIAKIEDEEPKDDTQANQMDRCQECGQWITEKVD